MFWLSQRYLIIEVFLVSIFRFEYYFVIQWQGEKNGSIEIVKLPVFLTTTTMDIMKYQKFRKSRGAPIRFISTFFWFGAHSGEVEPNHRSQNIYIYTKALRVSL